MFVRIFLLRHMPAVAIQDHTVLRFAQIEHLIGIPEELIPSGFGVWFADFANSYANEWFYECVHDHHSLRD